jgi:hypothetical protein
VLLPALEDASPREGMQDMLNKFSFSFMKLFKAKDYCGGVVPTNSDKNIFPLRIREGLIPEHDGDNDDGIFPPARLVPPPALVLAPSRRERLV